MYFKCFLIKKKIKTLCRSIGYILGFLIVLYFDLPFHILYSGQMQLSEVNVENINDEVQNGVKDTDTLVKYGELHSDEKAFVMKKRLDWSAPNKGDYHDIAVAVGRDSSESSKDESSGVDSDSDSEYIYEKKDHNEDEYDAEEYVNEKNENEKLPNPQENDDKSKIPFSNSNPGLAKLRYIYSIYNYVRGLVPAYEKEVEGWGKNVSRKTLDYINPNVDTSRSFIPKSYCAQKTPFILIIVCSTPKNLIPRQAIRQTWGRLANLYNITVFFLVGYSAESRINDKVKEENHFHRDLIIEDFHDSYNNLTLKTILMLRWVQSHCSEVPFVMKADDDIYVNLENLYKYTVKVEKINDTTKFLVGKLVPNAIPYRMNTHKWYMPFHIYQKEFFPNYTHGVAYMMSKEVASKLYRQSFKIDFIHLEDVFITGICAKAVNVTPVDQIEFNFHPNPSIACGSPNFTKLVIVAHHVPAIQMYRLHWEALRCSVIRI